MVSQSPLHLCTWLEGRSQQVEEVQGEGALSTHCKVHISRASRLEEMERGEYLATVNALDVGDCLAIKPIDNLTVLAL